MTAAPERGDDREILALRRVPSGGRARVVHLAPAHTEQLLRLSNLGLVPGVVVEVLQTRPAFVLAIGETRVALDAEITDGIWVKRVDADD